MDDRNAPSPEGEPNISDAAGLFHDPPRQPPVARNERSVDSDAVGHYELKEIPDPPRPVRAVSTPAPALPPVWPAAVSRPNMGASPAPLMPAPSVDPEEAVRQVWSRRAEWGGTLLFLALVALIFIGAFSWLMSEEEFGLAFLVIGCGGLLLVVLSYPILITLEVPVRVTPEQAARDFYASLSHHLPHYRRMWLLLSAAGRSSPSFGSFEGFRRYWKHRLAELRAGRAWFFTPLKFQVEEFQSHKSAGRVQIDVTFTVRVYIRGRQQEGPVETFRVRTSLVRGPDRMWYLDRGTLP
jgi:hypothetical protein